MQNAKCKCRWNAWGLLLVFVLLRCPYSTLVQTPVDITKAVNAAHTKYKTLQEGKSADYIPALACDLYTKQCAISVNTKIQSPKSHLDFVL